jgi:hypothetical protein
MRKASFLLMTALIAIAPACSDRLSTSANNFAPHGMWGSNKASLTITDSNATLQILSGNCYGAYGQVDQPIVGGSFDLPGTYTQLMGAYPGKIQYPARFSGTVAGNQLSLTVSVPALPTTFDPFVLTYGINSAWTPCLYP